MKKILLSALALLLSIGSLTANENRIKDEQMKSIEGTLLYRERMFLPPHSVITVTLEDVTHSEFNTTIASYQFEAEKSPPYTFLLKYDADQINDKGRYAFKATITNADDLLFGTSGFIDPFVKLLHVMLYRAQKKNSDVTLQNTYWKLLSIKNINVKTSENLKEPHFILKENQELSGFSGCNRFFGTYTTDNNTITFSQIGMTKMACKGVMELEHAFEKVLQEATHYKIQGEKLQLFNGTKVLASFRAVYF